MSFLSGVLALACHRCWKPPYHVLRGYQLNPGRHFSSWIVQLVEQNLCCLAKVEKQRQVNAKGNDIFSNCNLYALGLENDLEGQVKVEWTYGFHWSQGLCSTVWMGRTLHRRLFHSPRWIHLVLWRGVPGWLPIQIFDHLWSLWLRIFFEPWTVASGLLFLCFSLFLPTSHTIYIYLLRERRWRDVASDERYSKRCTVVAPRATFLDRPVV